MEDIFTEKEAAMNTKSLSLARVFPVLLLCLLCLIPTAYADIGPKPEVTITMVNAPEGEVYLDLLAEGTPTDDPYSKPPYPDPDQTSGPAILENLRSLEGDGWVLAYTTGVSGRPPVFGDVHPREDGTWRYSYVGLPETFRVAVATADAAQAAEVPFTREFFSNIVYDWETNTVREATPSPLRFLIRLAATLVPTLIIEGVIFWLFGCRERRSWLVFLAANVVTQLALHLFLSTPIVLAAQHPTYYAVVFIPSEIAICAAEAIAYAVLLREKQTGARVWYAIAANLTSAVLGYFPLHLLYDFLMKL